MNRMSRSSILEWSTIFVVMIAALVTLGVVTAQGTHRQVRLQPVDGSGVAGMVNLTQIPRNRGTHITW